MSCASIDFQVIPPAKRNRRVRRGSAGTAFVLVSVAAGALLFGSTQVDHVRLHNATAASDQKVTTLPRLRAQASITPENALLASTNFGGPPTTFAASAPLPSTFVESMARKPVQLASVGSIETEAAPAAEADTSIESSNVLLPPPRPSLPDLVDAVPVPTPRPPELDAAPVRAPFRTASRFSTRASRTVVAQAPAPDNRSVFEKLFGIGAPSVPGTVLAYATPGPALFGGTSRPIEAPAPTVDRQTAVYDISAHTVTMPDGTRLEAHSGLGNRLDDPDYVHERMRGPTPPHIYDLTMREKLFHGVPALRLNPVGNGRIFGRTGLLAHTYMLGPKGDSNGCVSFRNYDAFLQAYRSGQVRRLMVVARSS